ncbi:hypothetical protein VVD49_01740 [Uliginosibacterium sp. H3]|uniref:Uncharacterized protein n=1 Tax=Uliginosibacterium silvisoli TaxID=3114758 RepID=A0ABU6JXQ8_9RHOO|nr:hypothetical protein [Uliginosibacterium sp. H3]
MKELVAACGGGEACLGAELAATCVSATHRAFIRDFIYVRSSSMVTILRPHRHIPRDDEIEVAPAESPDTDAPTESAARKGIELGKKDSTENVGSGTASGPGEGPNPTA